MFSACFQDSGTRTSLKGDPGMTDGHRSVRYECFPDRKLRDSRFLKPECRQGPAAFPGRLGNIHSSAADPLHEKKDNHTLFSIVRCSTRACLKNHYCDLQSPLNGECIPNLINTARQDSKIWDEFFISCPLGDFRIWNKFSIGCPLGTSSVNMFRHCLNHNYILCKMLYFYRNLCLYLLIYNKNI